jgi:hypothetical protein
MVTLQANVWVCPYLSIFSDMSHSHSFLIFLHDSVWSSVTLMPHAELFTELPLLTLEDNFGKSRNTDVHGCTNPRQQVTKFCVVVRNISGSLVRNLLLDTLLAPSLNSF